MERSFLKQELRNRSSLKRKGSDWDCWACSLPLLQQVESLKPSDVNFIPQYWDNEDAHECWGRSTEETDNSTKHSFKNLQLKVPCSSPKVIPNLASRTRLKHLEMHRAGCEVWAPACFECCPDTRSRICKHSCHVTRQIWLERFRIFSCSPVYMLGHLSKETKNVVVPL